METHRRKADGRRVFTPQFKQAQVARIERHERTVAELARELVVEAQLIRTCAGRTSVGRPARYAKGDDRVLERRHRASRPCLQLP